MAVDPITKCIACQFSIDPLHFEFEIGTSLQPPTLPGLSSLIKAVIEGIIETILFFIKPLVYILTGKIPKLLGWIADAMSNPVNFIMDAINLAIVDPYTSKLLISTPATELPVPGLPNVPIPAINPGKPGFADNPQWIFQVPAFFKFLFSILLLPIYLLIYVFKKLVTTMKFPPLTVKTFKKIWSEIVPDLGLPTIDSVGLMTKFGKCLLDNVEEIIPPPAPIDGAAPASNPPQVQVFFDPTGINKQVFHDTSLELPAGTPFNKILRVQRISTNYSFGSVSLQPGFGTPNDFVCNFGSFTIDTFFPTQDIPIQYTAATPAPGISGSTCMIKQADPQADPFYFFLVSGRKNSYDLLREAYASPRAKIQRLDSTAINKMGLSKPPYNLSASTIQNYLESTYTDYADPWDPFFNLFGMRKEHAATNAFEDILGCAVNYGTEASPVWRIYAWKATTRPGKQYRDSRVSQGGVDTFLPGFYPVIWKRGLHPIGGGFPGGGMADCLVENMSVPSQFSWCNVFKDLNKTCDPGGQQLWSWNVSMNCHYPSQNWQEYQFADNIHGASAGCQVLQSPNSFNNEFRPQFILNEMKMRRPGRYSYYLMLKDDFEELWNAINPHDQVNPTTRRWSNGGLVEDPP
jgi:hypothetical protein